MTIQWFPGHMNAAQKQAEKAMEQTDLVIEVVDARLPGASTNPLVAKMRAFRQRPCLKILNKSDLADPLETKKWLDYFNKETLVHTIALTTKQTREVAKIPALCESLVPHRTGPGKPVRLMIMGIPNVGKSTLMNMLLKKRVAKVGDEPAVTKTQQKLYVKKNMLVTDTPGLMWPKIAYDEDGYMLAASHAIGVNALIPEEVGTHLGDILLVRYLPLLKQRYQLKETPIDGVALIEAIAQKRGFKVKGGALDLEKAALVLLQDYRSGALGRITLETPTSRQEMIDKYASEAK